MYIFGHILFVFSAKDLLFSQYYNDVYLKKDENSPVFHVSVDDIRKELEAEPQLV